MSLTPILVAVELGFLLALAVRGARLSEQLRAAWPAILYVAWLAAYALCDPYRDAHARALLSLCMSRQEQCQAKPCQHERMNPGAK